MLGVHPLIVGVAHRQALELDPRLLALGQALGQLARLHRLIAFEQGVIQRRAVLEAVASIGIRRCKHLAIQVDSHLRLALIEVRRRDPAQRIGRHRHAFTGQLLVVTNHLGGTRTGLQRPHAVDAPTRHVVVGLGVRGPGLE
ncbi:hypothetical protein D3C80_1322500 [compost metagenome]